jgi:translocation and assembly module TamA
LFFLPPPARALTNVCPGIDVRDGRIRLDANERVLVCGKEKAQPAWKEVPLSQAQYMLNVILQNRGYFHARFERQGEGESEKLIVTLGGLTRVTGIEVAGDRGLIDIGKKRGVVDEPLEPSKLDEVERWAQFELENHGYACPIVDTRAEAWNGKIVLDVKGGGQKRIGRIERLGYDGLDVESFRRFEAFQPGDVYDVVDTQITTTRLLNYGFFQDAMLAKHCRGDLVDLTLTAHRGKAHIFRFGIGASTEEFPFADIWYKNTFLDHRASSYTAGLRLSPRRQGLDLSSELYVVPWSHLFYLGPRAKIERRDENAYETNRLEVGADLGRQWDMGKVRLAGTFGPTWNYERTARGVGPGDVDYLSWDGHLLFMSHYYEAFTGAQDGGWTGEFRFSEQRKGVGADLNVDRYELSFKHLWNVGNYAPPLFVFAARMNAIGVNFSEFDNANRDALPVAYRIYYGGNENLRGFARSSLDNGGLGFLTALSAGFELRLIEQLPFHLQPFLLADVGQLGGRSFKLFDPLYTSTGAGLRWPSPFGTLRGLAAHGNIANGDASTQGYKQEWVYFVSFGQEF